MGRREPVGDRVLAPYQTVNPMVLLLRAGDRVNGETVTTVDRTGDDVRVALANGDTHELTVNRTEKETD